MYLISVQLNCVVLPLWLIVLINATHLLYIYDYFSTNFMDNLL